VLLHQCICESTKKILKHFSPHSEAGFATMMQPSHIRRTIRAADKLSPNEDLWHGAAGRYLEQGRLHICL